MPSPPSPNSKALPSAPSFSSSFLNQNVSTGEAEEEPLPESRAELLICPNSHNSFSSSLFSSPSPPPPNPLFTPSPINPSASTSTWLNGVLFSIRMITSDFYLEDIDPENSRHKKYYPEQVQWIQKNENYHSTKFRHESEKFQLGSPKTAIKVPILRVYGPTPMGQSACLHLHQVFPYFLIRPQTPENTFRKKNEGDSNSIINQEELQDEGEEELGISKDEVEETKKIKALFDTWEALFRPVEGSDPSLNNL